MPRPSGDTLRTNRWLVFVALQTRSRPSRKKYPPPAKFWYALVPGGSGAFGMS
jgi:hypothetical protein